jgi:hypothetical protein
VTPRRVGAVVGVGLALGWAVLAGTSLLRAADELRAGRAAARSAVALLHGADTLDGGHATALVGAAEHFRAARRELGGARLVALRVVPVLGRQLDALRTMSKAAADVADITAEAVRSASRLTDSAPPPGPERLETVAGLRQIIHHAASRLAAVDVGPGRALVAPVADAHDEFTERVTAERRWLRQAGAGLDTLQGLLSGQRRYLLIAANNAEMRAGSGMWLAGGLLSGGGGRLRLGPMGSLYEIARPPDGSVTVRDRALAAHWSWMHPEREWRSLMPSPRLAPSAALAVAMWEAAGQPPVDGIIVVDVAGLAEVVRATGPVVVDGRHLDADLLVQELLHGQYERYGDPAQPRRREVLAATASSVLAALDATPWRPRELADRLADAARGRHLLAWSSDPLAQSGWAGASVDGALRRDSLALSVLNRGGNKLDPFLAVEARLRTRTAGGATQVSVTVDLTNTTPAGKPAYVVGPAAGTDLAAGEYRGLITVNLPAGARRIRLEGARTDLRGGDGPTWMVAAEFRLPRGGHQVVTLHFSMPGTHGAVAVEPSARVPAVQWAYDDHRWTDAARRTVAW